MEQVQHPFLICESQDRWTKLVRRYAQHADSRLPDSTRIIRVPGSAFLEQQLVTAIDPLVAIDISTANAQQVLRIVAAVQKRPARTRFVGLGDDESRNSAGWLRSCGLHACYFSLTRVQSLVKLAQRHFADLALSNSLSDRQKGSLAEIAEQFRNQMNVS